MLLLHADGGCHPNPGQARYGVVARANGQIVDRLSRSIGHATNNVAEWRGAIAALDYAVGYTIAYPERRVELRMDSQLVVRQLTGRYKVKHLNLKPLAKQARDLMVALTDQGVLITVVWVPREQNTEADALT
jgi:probable phosphoglycerate mutase